MIFFRGFLEGVTILGLVVGLSACKTGSKKGGGNPDL